MTDTPPQGRHPAESAANMIYLLYALGLLFVVLSVVGVLFAHLKGRGEMPEGLRTHYAWLVRTFWWPFLLGGASMLLVASVLGAVPGAIGMVAAAAWYIHRIVRGWLLLRRREPIPDPTSLF